MTFRKQVSLSMDLKSEIELTEQSDQGGEIHIFGCNNPEWSAPHWSQAMPRDDEKSGLWSQRIFTERV